MTAAMAHTSEEQINKYQYVEIFDSPKDRWTLGKLCEIRIRESDRQKMYFLEYEEYAAEIDAEDAHSVMRIPANKREPNDYTATEELLNFLKEIPTQAPVSRETQIVMNVTRRTTIQRTIYLYIKNQYTLLTVHFLNVPKQSKSRGAESYPLCIRSYIRRCPLYLD